MVHPNGDRARVGFAAFSRDDLDAMEHQFFTEDIRCHVPGRSPASEGYEGVDQVLGFSGSYLSTWKHGPR